MLGHSRHPMWMHLRFVVLLLPLAVPQSVIGQTRHQEKTRAAVEQALTEMERQWAEVCANRDTTVLVKVLADDFLGTNTNGDLYTKRQDIDKIAKATRGKYASGRLDSVKIRFFGDNVAVLHGVETCMRKTPDGKEEPETSIWTDTWLKRKGRWQIVAAQDAIYQRH